MASLKEGIPKNSELMSVMREVSHALICPYVVKSSPIQATTAVSSSNLVVGLKAITWVASCDKQKLDTRVITRKKKLYMFLVLNVEYIYEVNEITVPLGS